MAISANELRIGNMIEANGPMMEVKAIYSDHVELCLNGAEADNWDEDLEACNGIPLTPEVLEACRFFCMVVSDKSRYPIYRKEYYIEIIQKEENMFFFSFNRRFVEIKYLHQLQNLYFALTGHDLPITNLNANK